MSTVLNKRALPYLTKTSSSFIVEIFCSLSYYLFPVVNDELPFLFVFGSFRFN